MTTLSAHAAKALLGLSLLVWPQIGLADEADQLGDRQLDCLIESRVAVKLGAAIGGLLANVMVDRGDFVKAGQVVAHLESAVEEANVALARAKASNDLQVLSNQARSEFLRRKFTRQENLLQSNNVARSTYDEAETDAKMSEFSTKEAQLNLEVGKLELTHQEELLKQREIRSPINGVVQERTLFAGQYTNDTNHIMTIAQIDPLNVEVFVPIAFYGQIAAGGVAEILPENPIGGSYSATVTIVDRVIDASSGTFGVRLEMPNPDYRLPAGVRCKIRFGRPYAAQDLNDTTTHSVTVGNQSARDQIFAQPSVTQAQPEATAKSSASDHASGTVIPAADSIALLAPPSLPPPVISTTIQNQRTSLSNAPLGLSRPAATENSPPPETNGRQPPANENGRPSQPLAATSPTTPSAQGQMKPQSPVVDEAQPGADRKPLQAENSNSSVAVPPQAAALPVALSTLGPPPYPPSPEIKDVMDVGAQPKPPPSTPVARRAPKPPSSQVKGAQALPGASRRQLRPVNGEPVVARQSAAAAPASRSAAGQAPSSSSPKPSAAGQTKPTVNGQTRRQNRAGPTTANTETSHQRGTPTSF
jgi:RND family efflux transporter MFP subunit